MKKAIISFVYRYHYWAYQVRRYGLLLLITPICWILSLVLPSHKKKYSEDLYLEFKDHGRMLKNVDPIEGLGYSGNRFTVVFLMFLFLGLGNKCGSKTIAMVVFGLLLLLYVIGCDYQHKKTGYYLSFGPDYKQYFKQFIDEPLWQQCLWFAFFTSVYALLMTLLIRWAFK